MSELIRDPTYRGRGSKGVRRGEEQGPGQREIDVEVPHRQFLVDGGDRNVRAVDVNGATPVEAIADRLPIEIGLLMRDFGGVKEDAVLNDPAHAIARVGFSLVRQVKKITVDGRHATGRALAHRTWSLHSPVDGVVGEANFDRVQRPAEGEDVNHREHAVLATADFINVEPFFTGRPGSDH